MVPIPTPVRSETQPVRAQRESESTSVDTGGEGQGVSEGTSGPDDLTIPADLPESEGSHTPLRSVPCLYLIPVRVFRKTFNINL